MQSARSGRVPLLDELRGLSILLMVLYHGAFDLIAFCGVSIPLYDAPLLQRFFQPLFAGLFILISGAACRYSRSNPRRALLTLGCALAVTLVTLAVSPDFPDLWGILHLLGSCMLLFPLIRPLLDRLPPGAGAALCGGLFLLFYRLPYGALGIGPLTLPLPDSLYQTAWLYPLGLPASAFASADYFPLLPWAPLFLAGACLGRPLREGRLPPGFYRSRCRPLAAAGRHTLWIYLLHQPALLLILPPTVSALRALGVPL